MTCSSNAPGCGSRVTGMAVTQAGWLLNDFAEYVFDPETSRPGRRMQLFGGPLVEIVRVTEPAAHLLVASQFYGRRFRALQLVHADYRGHRPWESGYRGSGRGGQPVLGVRAVPPASAA
jgi:hypothetical protein